MISELTLEDAPSPKTPHVYVDIKTPEKSPPPLTCEAVPKAVKPFTESQLNSLYENQELTLIDAFVAEFVDVQLRSSAIRQQHRLHELCTNYLRVRNHLLVNSHELESLKKSCKSTQQQLWCLDKTTITESGECQDGNPVNASFEYSIAHFHEATSVALTRNLSAIKESLHNVQALRRYEAETLRLQIELYVQRVCTSCKDLASLPPNAPVCLAKMQMSSHTMPQLMELRMCITVLFNFQRKITKDAKFVSDTREWLSKLVAVLLRVATWQDHLFLLSHVLRCPGGVTSWAREFVQVPVPSRSQSSSPLNDAYLDHMVAVLGLVLTSVKDREKFLEQVQMSWQEPDNPTNAVWVILDEDGEEDEDIEKVSIHLFENDLVALLHQIPLDKMFEHILFIERSNNNFRQDKSSVTENHLLRIFAFFTVITKLLQKGLKAYNSPRYRQLAKRLSSLIKDIVQYASDLWEAFDKTKV